MPARGQRMPEEMRLRISTTLKAHPVSPETRAKISIANRKYRHTPEARAKISAGNRRRFSDPAERTRMSELFRGHSTSKETRAKISAAQQGKARPNQARDRCNFWRGGVSYYASYGPGWKRIRDQILKSPGACCLDCGAGQDLVVHHRDGNKRNCCEENLRVLCRSCHSHRHYFGRLG